MKIANVTLEHEVSNPSIPLFTNLTQGLDLAGRTLRVWRQRANTRRVLRNLSPAGLDDIGRSRQEAIIESNKPFWRE